MAHHVLLVDDDELICRSLGFNLQRSGYRVSTATSAEQALSIAQSDSPDVVLLDIGLPLMNGLDALRHFRELRGVPVIFVTARRRELDEVLGLEMGADDYITKPFDLAVLLARIKAVLRRATNPDTNESGGAGLVVGDLAIDPVLHQVKVKERVLDLTPREFALLYTLASEAGRIFSVDEILNRVWGAEYAGEPQVIYVHIRWLREKIEEDAHHPHRIISVRGIGYKLESPGA